VTRPEDLAGDYRRYLAALVMFHLAAADEVGLTGTDYQASNVLQLDGPMPSGELAHRLGLSSGATTRLIDRMVAAGYARRVADPGDRRRVLVEHTGYRPDRLTEILATVTEPIAAILQALSADQRTGLGQYLVGSAEAYRAAARALRDGPGDAGR
jgi:DNA-binding MarR family transcriptional regulator